MAFNPMNPISAPKITSSPPSPMTGTRGLYPTTDGWVDIDDDGTEKKLLDENSISGITPTVCSDINEAPYKTGWFISSDKSTMVLSYVSESTGNVLESLKGYQIQIPSNGNIKYRYFYTGSVITTDQKSGVWQDYLFDLQNVVDKDGSEYTLDERDYVDCNLMYDSSNGVGLLCKYSRGSAGGQSFYLRIDKTGISYKRSSANPLDQSSWEYITYTQEEIDAKLDGKVDKVEGKGLSSNNYTTEEKEKLNDLPTKKEINNALDEKLNSADAVGTKVANGGELFNAASEASGMYSHAEGVGSAKGFGAHAENSGTAEGSHSHAEGQGTLAKGGMSHAQGYFTEAGGNETSPQHVEGRWNIRDTENKYIHIAGNGQPPDSTGYENSSNAHTLDWDGNAWFAGKVSIGTDNKLLETETNVQALAPIDNVITYTLSSTNHNTENRISSALGTVTITISLSTDGYPNNYISSLVFTTAANSNITMAYTGTGALQWVGTDCDVQDGYSVFAPQSGKTYDIVFYFNGTKFIGLVNGYENVSVNTGA